MRKRLSIKTEFYELTCADERFRDRTPCEVYNCKSGWESHSTQLIPSPGRLDTFRLFEQRRKEEGFAPFYPPHCQGGGIVLPLPLPLNGALSCAVHPLALELLCAVYNHTLGSSDPLPWLTKMDHALLKFQDCRSQAL